MTFYGCPTKIDNGILCSLFSSFKLSWWNDINKVRFKNSPPATLWTWNMALWTSKCGPHVDHNSWSISLGESIAKSHHKGYVFYLTKPLRVLFLTIFLMKQLHLMTEILGLLELQKSKTVNSRKNEMHKRYLEGNKDSKIFGKVNSSKE